MNTETTQALQSYSLNLPKLCAEFVQSQFSKSFLRRHLEFQSETNDWCGTKSKLTLKTLNGNYLLELLPSFNEKF